MKTGGIQTFSGGIFYPLWPTHETIKIQDIAHALSYCARFGGHSQQFYSVAQHCIIMSRYFRKQGDADKARWALLHDAAEAYVLDMPRPIKYLKQMSPYRVIEKNVQYAIFRKYDLLGEPPPEIKELDSRIVAAEAKALLSPLNDEWRESVEGIDTTDLKIKPYKALKDAERFYLKEFSILFPKHLDK